MERTERAVSALTGIWLALGAAGCVSFTWERGLRHEPPDPAVMETLEPGYTTLESALDGLGAPLWVWEYAADQGSGAALAYGWYRSRDRGVRVRAPLGRASPSFTYNRIDSRMEGLVLFFDQDWRLEYWRQGLLVDLTAEFADRRPAYLEAGGSEDKARAGVPGKPPQSTE